MCSLILFVLTTSCKNPINEDFVLRQIMREEDGTVCRRVYNIPGVPGEEFVEIYFKDGRIKEQYYRKNGKLNGVRMIYYANGQLSETGNWRDDQRSGLFLYYRMNGELDCTQNFSLLGDKMKE
jgi:antitoxin component YwqK of YwqJK toxin-antitoxin module